MIHPLIKVSDLDFANDIAPSLDTLEEARNLLTEVENAPGNVGLHLKLKRLKLSHTTNRFPKSSGSWIDNTQKDIKVRIAQAWVAYNKLSKICKSNLNRNLKTRLFMTTVESVLLYGCES